MVLFVLEVCSIMWLEIKLGSLPSTANALRSRSCEEHVCRSCTVTLGGCNLALTMFITRISTSRFQVWSGRKVWGNTPWVFGKSQELPPFVHGQVQGCCDSRFLANLHCGGLLMAHIRQMRRRRWQQNG